MTKRVRVPALIQICLLAACAAYEVGGQFFAGRRALLVNDPATALGYFLATAERDPNYVFYSHYYRQGIWTYVGRAQYETKKYKEGRESLERALAADKDDNMARLYLGLTLARTGDLSRGVKEIESAMKGIHAWLEYIELARPFEVSWDPSREIRGTIEKEVASMAGKDFNPEQLIVNAEWLGNRMEEEIDWVRRDERRQFERDFDGRRGSSVGIGF